MLTVKGEDLGQLDQWWLHAVLAAIGETLEVIGPGPPLFSPRLAGRSRCLIRRFFDTHEVANPEEGGWKGRELWLGVPMGLGAAAVHSRYVCTRGVGGGYFWPMATSVCTRGVADGIFVA